MFDFFSDLGTAQQIFWGCALGASLIFIFQTTMMLIGIGGDSADFDGMDTDTGLAHGGIASEAMQMLSLRNMVNFFLGFGWGGVCLGKYIESNLLLTVVAVLIGVAFVALFLFIFKQMMRLEHSGNIDLERDIVGKEADVYLVIREGDRGKVQLSVNGSVHEYDAICADRSATIPTGARVRITSITGTDTVIVEQI